MRLVIAVSGASGLIGAGLCAVLAADGHRVLRLVRRSAAGPDEVTWDPEHGIVDPQRLEGVDALVHLAGESIAAGRWTRRRMEAIRRSRVDATRALRVSLSRLERRPTAFLCASAIGIYGDRGEEVLTEESPAGQGFLPDLCRAWEAEATAGTELGMRCVQLRFGVVLSPEGGLLARLLTPFRWGLGGPVGDGNQFVSWVSLDDAIGAIRHLLVNERMSGPVNVVAPEPVTSRDLARALGRVLHRPAVLRVPAAVLRLLFGRLADEVLLASTRVQPGVLLCGGYSFRHPQVDQDLRHLLGQAPV